MKKIFLQLFVILSLAGGFSSLFGFSPKSEVRLNERCKTEISISPLSGAKKTLPYYQRNETHQISNPEYFLRITSADNLVSVHFAGHALLHTSFKSTLAFSVDQIHRAPYCDVFMKG